MKATLSANIANPIGEYRLLWAAHVKMVWRHREASVLRQCSDSKI
jgi:hypothetical protein